MLNTLVKRTWAEVDLDKLKNNYLSYKSQLNAKTEIMCVVKAFCYGHSEDAVVLFLQNELGVKNFAVSNIDEAVRLRKLGITGDILILGYTSPEAAQTLSEYNIIQTILDASYAERLNASADRRIRCHAAIDTGMTRIGFRGNSAQIAESLLYISRLEKLSLEGAFTHYAAADSLDESDTAYTARQTKLFFEAADLAEKMGVRLGCLHTLNSAGGLFHSEGLGGRSQFVRLGIVLYGLKPDSSLELPVNAEPVMSLKSLVTQVKTIESGVDISYGRTYTSDRPMKIATVCCGYADGYPRALSNRGEVIIRGKRCKITGRVCMDQFMCDVTGVDVSPGDTATLIGKDGSETITADDIADLAGTIGYEIVCGISARVPRIAVCGNIITDVCRLNL